MSEHIYTETHRPTTMTGNCTTSGLWSWPRKSSSNCKPYIQKSEKHANQNQNPKPNKGVLWKRRQESNWEKRSLRSKSKSPTSTIRMEALWGVVWEPLLYNPCTITWMPSLSNYATRNCSALSSHSHRFLKGSIVPNQIISRPNSRTYPETIDFLSITPPNNLRRCSMNWKKIFGDLVKVNPDQLRRLARMNPKWRTEILALIGE